MRTAHGHEAENSITCASLHFPPQMCTALQGDVEQENYVKNIQLWAINLSSATDLERNTLSQIHGISRSFSNFLQKRIKLNAIWLECQFPRETDISDKNSKILVK